MASTSSDSSDSLDSDGISRRDSSALEQSELQNISRVATDLNQHVLSVADDPHIFDDPGLDPASPDFDHYRWAETVLGLVKRSGITIPEQDVVFANLTVSGSGASLQFQDTVLTSLAGPFVRAARLLAGRTTARRRILHSFDGLVCSGEMLLVLGRPGSGCTTLLKTLTGHLNGLCLEPASNIHFRGIAFADMVRHYRGEFAYNQEVDQHFPHLTVGETLAFAAAARAPAARPPGLSRDRYAAALVKVVMAIFGLSHTFHTKVGDNFVRGVSGGERKRVSIAEMFLSRVRFGAWDNSTRGLDAASALQFTQALRRSADLGREAHAVAAYQASQSMYELFDSVVVLYEGREIFFGPVGRAVAYLDEMGWARHPQQSSPDFLTAVTNPGERRPRAGMDAQVPRTAAEFEAYWRRSADYRQLQAAIAAHEAAHPLDGREAGAFQQQQTTQKARHTRLTSPYLLTVAMQIRLCLQRGYQLLRNDLPTTLSTVVVQTVLSLIIGSIFYDAPSTTASLFSRGAVMFFAVLMNALITTNEVLLLYKQRPMVEKQAGYAFVHPFSEALASVLIDLPIKFVRCSAFSLILYFLADLNRTPGQFFTFLLFLLTAVVTMSGIFRTLAAVTQTSGQAMGLVGIIVLCILVYTGFTLPQPSMHPWLSWIRWINPIFYTFEALISNEFHGRELACSAFIPSYGTGVNRICSAVGAVAGQTTLSGDAFIAANYEYYHAHLWRNYGIVLAFLIAFHVAYLVATELRTGTQSKAEALVYRPGHAPKHLLVESSRGGSSDADLEKTGAAQVRQAELERVSTESKLQHLPPQTDILLWTDLCYDIPVKEGTRRLLDHVHGWVKPGTLTALMGVSGAGKTTLLDVLAQRTSIGVVSGDILVNGRPLMPSFPRRTGYVQQQDMHLETATVREALRFSAVLRQPRATPQREKYHYVEEVIAMLGMGDFAEAVVGVLGEGLNVEQRKLLSIGVELVAKPSLLVFLDEPTSGLDSQSSWTIVAFLRKLADHGQAVLATIHQPSAIIMQTFDRLLFLAKGGRTVYFGDIGEQSSTLVDYFVRNGARPLQELENPAEYILNMVSGDGALGIDWVARWNGSPEMQGVLAEVGRLKQGNPDAEVEREALAAGQQQSSGSGRTPASDETNYFALPMYLQFRHVATRSFQQYYRQPEYIFSKFGLGISSGLFIGFSFWKANNSQQGFQNALFSVFLLCSIFSILVNQIMPKFVAARSLYEVRERPSRVYSWQVFILTQLLVEIPWQTLLGVCAYACFYFSTFGTGATSDTKGLVLLFVVQFYVYSASMATMVVAGLENTAMAAMFAMLMFGMSFIFNGVMQPPDALPGFWIFMYRVSPFSYYVAGIGSAALHARTVQCSARELSIVDPPAGVTCGDYLTKYATLAGGAVYNPEATAACEYCAMTSADQYLLLRKIVWSQRWRNYGIFVCYFVFNVFATVVLYYLLRVKQWKAKTKKAAPEKSGSKKEETKNQ